MHSLMRITNPRTVGGTVAAGPICGAVLISNCFVQDLRVVHEWTTLFCLICREQSPTFSRYKSGDDMKRVAHLSLFVCMVFLGACSASFSDPITEETESTPDVLPTITPISLPTQTSPAEVMPSQAPTTGVAAVDFSPVVYAERYDANTFLFLMGGVSRDGWFTAAESAARYPGAGTYSLHTMTEGYKYFVQGMAPDFSPAYQIYSIRTDVSLDERGMVGVLDGWDITKRDVTELSADGEFYQQAVIDWLKTQGVDEPQPGVLQIFRVDLEGDSTDEIFISATHLDESQHMTYSGDYSIVLMRKVVGNDVVTLPVVWDVYLSQEAEMTFPITYTLANFIDLNQDGVLEVVVDIQKWEGDEAIVYQIDGQRITEVLRAE